MALRCTLESAICWALAAAVVAMAATPPTRSGYMTAHSSACMPPMEPPTTASHRSMPRSSATAAWVRTMSRMLTTGNVEPYGRPGGRVDRGRAGAALAAAEHVDAHDEEPVGVERPARTDERVPPALGGMAGPAAAGGVAVTGEGVAHEHGVGGVGVELAPGLVGDRDGPQLAAALEHERALRGQRQEPSTARGVTRPPRPGGGQQVGAQGRPTGRIGHRAPRTGCCRHRRWKPHPRPEAGWHLGCPPQVAGPGEPGHS